MSNAALSLPAPILEASHHGPALMLDRRALGIPRELFALLANCSVRTLATYEKEADLPDHMVRPVYETLRLLVALEEIVGESDSLRDWLETKNPAFDDRSPMQVIHVGESDLIWEMIYQIRSGTFA